MQPVSGLLPYLALSGQNTAAMDRFRIAEPSDQELVYGFPGGREGDTMPEPAHVPRIHHRTLSSHR